MQTPRCMSPVRECPGAPQKTNAPKTPVREVKQLVCPGAPARPIRTVSDGLRLPLSPKKLF